MAVKAQLTAMEGKMLGRAAANAAPRAPDLPPRTSRSCGQPAAMRSHASVLRPTLQAGRRHHCGRTGLEASAWLCPCPCKMRWRVRALAPTFSRCTVGVLADVGRTVLYAWGLMRGPEHT